MGNKQRKHILENRKKVELKQIPETLQVFRPPKGADLKEFMRQVELGTVQPIGNVQAKLATDTDETVEVEIKTVRDSTVTP